MATVIEIANNVLIGLGADPISSLTETNVGAVSVNAHWNIVRRELLRKHTWNFAIKRQELARSTNSPIYMYKYSYALPPDNIRIIQVYNESDYKVENGLILTDSERCVIKYISDITDTSKWTADFTELMVAKLMHKLAFAITRDKDLTGQYHTLYAARLQEAILADTFEDFEDSFVETDGSIIKARY